MKTAVVFVSYLKVPEQRLLEHFRWNGAIYERHGVKVWVVSDVQHDLPPYAECLVFHPSSLPIVKGKRRFSLTRTKNFGNNKAINNGADVVVCTDVDIAFPENRFEMLTTVNDETANIPVYRMAPSFDRIEDGHLDHGCTGTVVMTAGNWLRLPFDERCVGYGADDGILLRAIQRAPLEVNRDVIVSHIAHVPGDGTRNPGSGSSTCWGRADGFNFDNFEANRKFHK
jgi:hypothetical protein